VPKLNLLKRGAVRLGYIARATQARPSMLEFSLNRREIDSSRSGDIARAGKKIFYRYNRDKFRR
jgi:hypothetical protein